MHVVPALHGRGRSGHVALTFDDGPDPTSTPAFLAELDRLGWSATFFMLGTMARKAPGLVAEVAAAGHEIAVHGDEHRNMLRRSPWSARADIRRCRDTLAELAGCEPAFFRPPFGTCAFGAFWGARSAGLTTVLWTNWGRDWRGDASPEIVAEECSRAGSTAARCCSTTPTVSRSADRGATRWVRWPCSPNRSQRATSRSDRCATTACGAHALPLPVSDTALSVGLALLGGGCYATAAVLQQRVAAEQPIELALSPRLIGRLIRRPLWLLGISFDIAAYAFEAAALGVGSVVVVGPVLVSSLLFAIPLATVGKPARVTRRDLSAAILVVIGLAVFVGIGEPRGNSSVASATGWIAGGGVIALIAGVAVVCGRRARSASERALLFGLATGTLYALTAVLTKATVDLFDHGVLDSLSHWQPYALVTVSVAGLVLNQSAFQAGHLAASLPAISVTNPVLSAALGVALFGERFGASGALAVVATTLAVVAMIVGTIRLARSPLVTQAHVASAALPVS
jgi:drug/metabolite transporter (DMT)-like permease